MAGVRPYLRVSVSHVTEDSVVHLLGLDVGSTTTSALTATARVARDPVQGRLRLHDEDVRHRLGPVLTPLDGEDLDLDAIAALLDGWLAAAGLDAADLFAGGALVTGLAARRANADGLVELIRARVGDAVVATARDPVLESWLAFAGAAAELSRQHPGVPILNLDIGGGTTNPAVGVDGDVLAAGCLHVGARHVRVRPGSSEVVGATELGRTLLADAGGDLAVVVARLTRALEDVVQGRPVEAPLLHVAIDVPAGALVVLSGGVGELVYARAGGAPPLEPAHFGDLGGELAEAILASEVLGEHVRELIPEHRGRATVYGVALHATEISGATLHVDPALLPLRDLPVVARLDAHPTAERLAAAVALVARTEHGGCIQLAAGAADGLVNVRRLGDRLARALAAMPERRVLVLLLEDDAATALGGYATAWGRAPADLLVIDQVVPRDAAFVTVGRARHGVVPVAFHGLR
jgi:ethanolamine utilization protein EutA